jgi:hypothetical protein
LAMTAQSSRFRYSRLSVTDASGVAQASACALFVGYKSL